MGLVLLFFPTTEALHLIVAFLGPGSIFHPHSDVQAFCSPVAAEMWSWFCVWKHYPPFHTHIFAHAGLEICTQPNRQLHLSQTKRTWPRAFTSRPSQHFNKGNHTLPTGHTLVETTWNRRWIDVCAQRAWLSHTMGFEKKTRREGHMWNLQFDMWKSHFQTWNRCQFNVKLHFDMYYIFSSHVNTTFSREEN